jgi:gluconolactonase
VVKRDGAIYFTDTFGAFRLREKDPRRELDFNAVYSWKDGKLTLVVKDMPATNGLAFSPDEKYLYVNGSRDKYVKRTTSSRMERWQTESCSSTSARIRLPASPTA